MALPRIPVAGGIGPDRLTRDPEMAEAWRRDRLIHTRVTGGLFREAERVQEELFDSGIFPTIPLLFLLPDADPVVDTRATLQFAGGIVGSRVDVEILEGRRHEPFNDLGREEVFRRVAGWLADLLD
jgi:alpha-beta hydrolase superfamily lysophospholipase